VALRGMQPAAPGEALAACVEVLARGYEGGRTLKWLKVKQPYNRQGERGWEPKGKS
jgi:hypothetical protein